MTWLHHITSEANRLTNPLTRMGESCPKKSKPVASADEVIVFYLQEGKIINGGFYDAIKETGLL